MNKKKIIVARESFTSALDRYDATLRASVDNGEIYYHSKDGRIIQGHLCTRIIPKDRMWLTNEPINTLI